MRTREWIDNELVRSGGVMACTGDPSTDRALRRRRASGALVRLLARVYALPGVVNEPMARIQAVALWAPDGIITGRAAARVLYWPGCRVDRVDVIANRRGPTRPWVRVHRLQVPPEATTRRGNLRLTTPAVTAVLLAASDGGEAIDEALRAGAVTPASLAEALALLPGLPGNTIRRVVIRCSRLTPWSPAERRLHLILFRAHFKGWAGNVTIDLGGHRVIADVAFMALRLVIEVDGRSFHSDSGAFERDRLKQNALVADGWTVLRVTWEMLNDPAYVLGIIRSTMRRCRR